MTRLALIVFLFFFSNISFALDGVMYHDAPKTLLNGQQIQFQGDNNGNLRVTLAGDSGAKLATINSASSSVDSGITTLNSLMLARGNNNGFFVQGFAPHSSFAVGNPIKTGGKVVTTQDLTLVDNDVSDIGITTNRAQIVKQYGPPELDWSYASTTGGYTGTADLIITSAPGAGLKNYLTSITIQNAATLIGSEIVIKSSSTVLWRGFVGLLSQTSGHSVINFTVPLRTATNTPLTLAAVTNGTTLYVNAQGYIAP